MNKLAVVVLNWNGSDILQDCIDSLATQTYKNYRIVIIDNDSKDDSHKVIDALAKKYTELLHVIYNDKNSGFAGGVNIGINYAIEHNFDGVALFNSDARADKNWLGELSKILEEKEEVGVATCLLLHEDGKTIDSTGDWYSNWGLSFPRNRDDITSKAPPSGYVFSGSGGASLYRVEMLKDIGLFDEAFFAYYEDVDISFRAQLANWKVYYNKKSIVYHEQGGTSKKIPGFTIKQTFRNLPMLYIKNVPTRFLFVIGTRLWLAYTLMLINTLHKGGFFYALKGWIESVLLTPSTVAKRISIQHKKKVSDEYIKSMLWNDLPPEQSGLRKFRKILSFGKID